MSVVGFDVGNDTSCVALARKRGIDVIMNKESKRETPAAVNFGDKMRFLGTDGYGKLGLSPQNTVHQIKRIIGKKFNDPQVQADVAKLPFTVFEGPDGGCLIKVRYCNEEHVFTPEQVMAMVLVDLKKIAEAEEGTSVIDCVISVPTYYTEAERYAMLNAASIAGLNCLRLINENTATALAYGIYKTDLPETDPVHVAFVDVGHSSTQVSIVSLRKGGMQVRSHAWDRNLGGRDLDEVLFNHFADEFQAKHKLDVRTNKKASFKLRVACEKLKKVLSANAESPLNVECLMEDFDMRSSMNRDKFEELATPILARLTAPMQRALADSGLTADDISSIEVVGSSTRVPAVFKAVEDFFKKTPSRTMNSKECVSRGAALQCAMLSPVFKVRQFEVIDSSPYTVIFDWTKPDGTPVQQEIFKRGDPFPNSKVITFMRSEDFRVSALYGDGDDILPAAFERKIGDFIVGPFQVPPGCDTAKLKVKVQLTLHGLLAIESVTSIIEEEVEEPKDIKMEDAAAAAANGGEAAAAAPTGDGPSPMETEQPAEAAKPAEPEPPKEKKKKVTKLTVPYQTQNVAGYTKAQLDAHFEAECQMQSADKLQEETNEKKNALEAYVYDLRNKLYESHAQYVKEADRDAIMQALQQMEDWLYDEGEDTTKSVYVSKLDELKKLGNPVELRAAEDTSRGPAVGALRQTCENYLQWARDTSSQYAHISQEERDTVTKTCQEALNWLDEKMALQSALLKHDDPVLLSGDVNKKRDMVERVCKPIMTKPAPPPPAPAPAPAPEEAKPAEPQPMETEAQPGAAPADGQAEPMQQ